MVSPAQAGERPLYMDSVLYSGDATQEWSFAPSASVDDFPVVGAVAGDSASATDTLAVVPMQQVPSLHQPFVALPIFFGAVGGAALGYSVAYAGALITVQDDSSDDLSAIGGAIAGFTLGEPLGVALGTHLGNGRQGSFGHDVVISLLSGWGGMALAAALGVPGVVIGSALQLGATAWAEQSSARRKHSEQAGASAR